MAHREITGLIALRRAALAKPSGAWLGLPFGGSENT